MGRRLDYGEPDPDYTDGDRVFDGVIFLIMFGLMIWWVVQ